MSASNENDREEQALDALIVAAFRQDVCKDGNLPDGTATEPVLSEEDQQALDALGPDLAERIVTGTWKPRSAKAQRFQPKVRQESLELAGAMHRGEDETELTKHAREEMERRIQELDSDDGEESKA